MSERPTPETDDQPTINAINDDGYAVPCVDIEFARKLERERDEAREKAERYRLEANAMMLQRDEARDIGEKLSNQGLEMMDENRTLKRERDEAREQIKELIYIAGRAIDLADLDLENDKFGVVSELRDGLKKIKEETK